MGGGPISPSSKPIPITPLTPCRATIDDLDDITWIAVNGSPDNPGTDHRFPYRDKYPQDFWKWTRIEHEELFERPDKLVILVVTAPVLDDGEVVHQPVSYGVWDLKVTSDFIPGDHGIDERRDANKKHMEAYAKALPAGLKKYFKQFGSDQIPLWEVVTHPDFRRRGAARTTASPLIHIVRHGQSLHNVDHGYSHRDPPLTDQGHETTKQIQIPAIPDLIAISPMTRTIQTAMNAFPSIAGPAPNGTKAKFPYLNFSECPQEWDHPPHSIEAATIRAEKVRRRLKELSKVYKNIVLITHRGFIAFLVKGDRYDVCETRSYRFGTDEETEEDALRFGVNVDTKAQQDFGPTLLVPHTTQSNLNA
ncbi:phosphoglycerate mutase [Fusarium mexicanum]|uniref:Phosphoglycerate mutase n=1 Tax=Fusarium mexicanum TaxID=751941 RepID=A0A8H5ILK7_9HYPO|nr:phosphoglycerate mutase [Fusarium mexicanum]